MDPVAAAIVSQPNNILAICYLRALMRLQSDIQPLPVLREGDYHSTALSPNVWPSA
jgi:predicted nucleotidyltransferase